jgi:hypothetical protein
MSETSALQSSSSPLAFLAAGALIGLVGVALFGLIHAAIIVPIWGRLLGGLPFGVLAGVAMGWALYELQRPSRERVRVITPLAFGALLWTTLIPMTLLDIALRVTGNHSTNNTWEVVGEFLLSVAAGGAAGRFVAGRWRGGLALGAASLAVTAAQAGPIHLMNSVRAARLFAAIMVVYVVCGLTLGRLASMFSQRLTSTKASGPEG